MDADTEVALALLQTVVEPFAALAEMMRGEDPDTILFYWENTPMTVKMLFDAHRALELSQL